MIFDVVIVKMTYAHFNETILLEYQIRLAMDVIRQSSLTSIALSAKSSAEFPYIHAESHPLNGLTWGEIFYIRIGKLGLYSPGD